MAFAFFTPAGPLIQLHGAHGLYGAGGPGSLFAHALPNARVHGLARIDHPRGEHRRQLLRSHSRATSAASAPCSGHSNDGNQHAPSEAALTRRGTLAVCGSEVFDAVTLLGPFWARSNVTRNPSSCRRDFREAHHYDRKRSYRRSRWRDHAASTRGEPPEPVHPVQGRQSARVLRRR